MNQFVEMPDGARIDLLALYRLLVMHKECNARCKDEEGQHAVIMWLSSLSEEQATEGDLTISFDRQLADYQALYTGHERAYEAPPPPQNTTGRAYLIDSETDAIKMASPRFGYLSNQDIGKIAGPPQAYTVFFYYPLVLGPIRATMAREGKGQG